MPRATPASALVVRFAARAWTGRVVVALALLAIAMPKAWAQSLAQAVEAAWQRDPQARQLEARRAELQARLDSAGALFAGPGALTLGARSDRFQRDQGDREYEVEIGAPVWLPGQRAASVGVVQGDLGHLDAQRQVLRNGIAAGVRSAWIELDTARSDAALADELAATLTELERDVHRRLEAGEASRFDANLIRGERLAADATAIEAQVRAAKAELALRTLTGLEHHGLYPEESQAPAAPPEHPQLALVREASALASARLRSAQASNRDNPELSLFLRRERGGVDEPYANSAGVKLRIPFSRASRVREGIAAAQAELERDEAALRNTVLRLPLEVEQARRELDAAGRARELAEARRQLAADNVVLARKSYDLGESDLAAFLRIRGAATEAQRAAERARLAVHAARARLAQARGLTP